MMVLSRALQTMLLLKMALLSAVVPTIAGAEDTVTLKRKDVSSEFRLSRSLTAGKLEDLWEKEAALAEREVERLLQMGGDMSFAPTPRPTPAPVAVTSSPTTAPVDMGSPTRAPIDIGTPAPTPEGTTFSPTTEGTLQPTAGDDSCLDGGTRTEFLLAQLSLVTDPALLEDPSTPQGQAFDYMTNSDPLMPNVCTFPTIDQRYGLATFYFSTNGDSWTENTGWLGPTQECDWFGVLCLTGVNVVDLILRENNVNGDLPNEISTLFLLERMGLFGNGLTSTIPTGISNLTSVTILDFENNFMDGSAIPTSILELSTLNALFFSRNLLTGTIPEDINRLTALEQFWVANNDMEGTIPATLGDLPNLQTIIANTNRFNGNIPTQLGSLDLTNLQLYENRLDGPIPMELYQATNLNVLRLDFNFLDGTIDPALGDLTSLEDLRLANNILNGALPDSISGLTNLRFLVVGSNFLSGAVPNVFADYVQLDTADFSRASFEGPVPDSIFLPTVRLVYMNNNFLSGEIPTSYTNADSVKDLFLNNNGLTGQVPPVAAGQLLELEEFTLQFNGLTGAMPQSVCDLRLGAVLEDLFSDCGGSNPEISCDFPACCNRCFESPGSRRRLAFDDSLILQEQQ